MEDKNKGWTSGLPTKSGKYWLYSYRYGKVSVGREQEPLLQLATVRAVSQGSVIIVADGQFVFKSEVECPFFKKAELPELPDIDTEGWRLHASNCNKSTL